MEEWRPVPGFEGLYEVSSLGRIRTVPRVVMRSNGAPQTIRERIRKPDTTPSGHLTVSLRINGKSRPHPVHRLVALAFIPNPENKPNVLHGDNNPANNRVDNLR